MHKNVRLPIAHHVIGHPEGAEDFFLSGIWGDQCIIVRDQGSTDPPGGPRM